MTGQLDNFYADAELINVAYRTPHGNFDNLVR
jgi:hypothetical protein